MFPMSILAARYMLWAQAHAGRHTFFPVNGLVLVTHFNHLHALGLPMEQVVREGSLRRLRSVLMPLLAIFWRGFSGEAGQGGAGHQHQRKQQRRGPGRALLHELPVDGGGHWALLLTKV